MIAVIAITPDGCNFAQTAKDTTFPDLALSNIEALAQESSGGFNCKWSADWTVCNSRRSGSGCPCGSGQW